MTKLLNISLERNELTPNAIRVDWDNDRHQRVVIKDNNPLEVVNALKKLTRLLEEEIYYKDI